MRRSALCLMAMLALAGFDRAAAQSWDPVTLLPRGGHAMAYDSARGRAIPFGGYSSSSGLLGDTLEWDGATWTERAASGPPPRESSAMACDSARGRVVLFGGYRSPSGGPSGGDTWEYGASCTSRPWYRDADADGFGDPGTAQSACTVPPGYVATGDDCDDADPAAHPGAAEVCNGSDDDCNGTTDDGGAFLCDDGDPCTEDTCAPEALCVYTLVDADHDGVCDVVDACPDSNLGLHVSIAGCDTGVPNTLLPDGCTLQDLIGGCGLGAANPGAFVGCVSGLADHFWEQGLLTGRERGWIQRCAARSSRHPAPSSIRATHERP